MEPVDVKFGEWIEQGFSLYRENFGILVLASLMAVLVSGITAGILAGPMAAGLLLIVFRLYDQKENPPEVGILLRGFDFFLNSFLFFLIWGIAIFLASLVLGFVPCLGQLASLFVVFLVHALLMFGMFLIVDGKMDFWPASVASFNMVKRNFWPFLGFSVVTNLIGSVGAVACGIGVVFTLPIQVCILTVAYRELFNEASNDSSVQS